MTLFGKVCEPAKISLFPRFHFCYCNSSCSITHLRSSLYNTRTDNYSENPLDTLPKFGGTVDGGGSIGGVVDAFVARTSNKKSVMTKT